MNRRRLTIGLLASAAVVVLLWAVLPRLPRAAVRWLDVGEPPRRADYVMLLLGDNQTRPFAAAALYDAGWAPRVLIAKTALTPSNIDKITPPNHEIARSILFHRGVPPERIILLPGATRTTCDEAQALARFLDAHPGARVMVLTSDFHTRRSRWMFARLLSDRGDAISLVSAPTDYLNMDCWWRDQRGMIYVVAEYLKFPFYVLRHGYIAYWLTACCALAITAALIRWRKSGLLPKDNGGVR